MKLAPDTLPCDLAVICRKPCFEVSIQIHIIPKVLFLCIEQMFIQRLNTFSDEEITSYNRDLEDQRYHKGSRAVEFCTPRYSFLKFKPLTHF